jgi:hypothetical protein
MEAQLKELVAIFGPTGGVLLWLLIQSVRGKKEPADPLQDLTEEMRRDAAALHRDLAEARDEQRREVADLRRELAAVREALAGMKATLEYMRERGK